jgi:hypothetical protein
MRHTGWRGLFAFACCTVMLMGCATTGGPAEKITFRLPLAAVTDPDGVEHQIPDGWAYEDADLSLIATGTEGIVGVNLENRSRATLRILWDQSAYVDEQGYSGRVVSGESRAITASLSQPTQSVPAGTRAAFYAVPAGNTGGPTFATCQEAEAGSVSLMLALEVKGEPREYLLRFETREVVVSWHDGWALRRVACEAWENRRPMRREE